jgi:hypothetical protein
MNKEIFKKEDFIFWEYYPTKCQYVGIIKDYYYTNSRYPSYRIDLLARNTKEYIGEYHGNKKVIPSNFNSVRAQFTIRKIDRKDLILYSHLTLLYPLYFELLTEH